MIRGEPSKPGFKQTEIYESAPLFKADNATLSFYATKDGKISVS